MNKPIRYVYIAGAYSSSPDSNTDLAIGLGNHVLRHRFIPFVPHLSHFWEQRHPHTWQEWLDIDFWWILRCDALLWDREWIPDDSSGATKEVEFAKKHGIPVFYSLRELILHQQGIERAEIEAVRSLEP